MEDKTSKKKEVKVNNNNVELVKSPTNGWSRHGPDDTFLPDNYANWLQYILDMEVREDDIWVISFPKCGTTWAQEMVWLLANDCDFDKAKEIFLHQRFPFLEVDAVRPKPSSQVTSMDTVAGMARTLPRFIKSHLPLSLLPRQLLGKRPKVIYVSRNPKDSCVSYFHHHALLYGYQGSMEDFTGLFLSNQVLYSPYWNHVKGFQKLGATDCPNLLLLSFEEMKRDLESVVTKTAAFLGKENLTAENLNRLLTHLSFEEMQKNPAVNYDDLAQAAFKVHQRSMKTQFIRKGKVGSWREEMSADSIKKFDQWIDDLQSKDNVYANDENYTN